MFCSNCGAEISFGEKFCGSCGTKIDATSYVNQGASADAGQAIQRIPIKKDNTGTVIAIVVVAIVLFFSGYFGYRVYNAYMAQQAIDASTEELIDSLDDIFN